MQSPRCRQPHPSHAAEGVRWKGGRKFAVMRQEQVGVSNSGAKALPQGLAVWYNREQRPDAVLDVLSAGAAQAREEQRDSNSNRLHQTCRPLNQVEHLCVEKCSLTTRHTAKRSSDSCGESHRVSGGLQSGGRRLVSLYARRFGKGLVICWSRFCGKAVLHKKDSPQGVGDKVAETMLVELAESGCPIFREVSRLSRGRLKSKGHGKLSIHSAADQDNWRLSHNGLCQSAQSLRSSCKHV